MLSDETFSEGDGEFLNGEFAGGTNTGNPRVPMALLN
jgi:hypothetical protein